MKSPQEENLELKPFELLLDQTTISRRINAMGQQITRDYKDKNPVLLGVLKGCIIFLADLIRVVNLPLEIEFVSATSYRHGAKREEELLFSGPSHIPLKGRHVLIVEGVVDSGRTVSTILEQVRKVEPASVEIVTLVDKPGSHRTEIDIAYKGFSIGNEFVIGFGLDNTQKYRNLPFIGKVIDIR
ncbi:MAG: hypoxanthine phosphoribosyltransferase [Candidatus Zixiibacteriota bacterium]|nr:MAG: hypoxanthine phosphoribosyltransferase [candidate division Zixibacteria bacterium]